MTLKHLDDAFKSLTKYFAPPDFQKAMPLFSAGFAVRSFTSIAWAVPDLIEGQKDKPSPPAKLKAAPPSTGCCYDNAVMERFFWSLKHEWTKH